MKNPSQVKIGLIGNMNNNHFAIMRYLRDLGYDAYLLLYQNDGRGVNSHFNPENDTWQLNKWKKFIIRTKLYNGGFKAFKYFFMPSYVKKIFNSYDIIIGNGFAPSYAFFSRSKLDLFIPYSTGVEFLKQTNHKNITGIIKSFIYRKIQEIGISNYTERAVIYDISEKHIKYIKKCNVKIENIGIPMVYVENNISEHAIENVGVKRFEKKSKNLDLILFSHVSHIWKKDSFNPGFSNSKRNHILINGFAKYINNYKHKSYKAKLFLVEYGHDIQSSKELIKSHNIEQNVVWLPLMSRKNILRILEKVSLGCGELGGIIWGGTGWEFISKGVPFFQRIDIDNKTFFEATGTPMPQILNVKSENEISKILLDFEKNPTKYYDKGKQLKKWFNNYNGINLVRKYADMLSI